MRNALIVHEVVTRATMKLLPVQSLCLLFISGLIQGVATSTSKKIPYVTAPGLSALLVWYTYNFGIR